MARRTGETTRQMLAAPQGAIYICCHEQDARGYSRRLAYSLGRVDLELVSTSWLDSERWHGRHLSAVVVDHACRLTDEQQSLLRHVFARVR